MMGRQNLVCAELPNLAPWVRKSLGFSENFDTSIGLCVVKTYDAEPDSCKLLDTFEVVGTLQWQPLTEKEDKERRDMIEANGVVPNNEFLDMPNYPVLHQIAKIENPLNLVPESLESQFSNLDLNASETC